MEVIVDGMDNPRHEIFLVAITVANCRISRSFLRFLVSFAILPLPTFVHIRSKIEVNIRRVIT